MSLGIFMKAFNNIYFGHYIDFIFEFIPQILVLNALFGYMDALIIAKWIFPFNLNWTTQADYTNIARAPSIIQCMINMFLKINVSPSEYDPPYISVI